MIVVHEFIDNFNIFARTKADAAHKCIIIKRAHIETERLLFQPSGLRDHHFGTEFVEFVPQFLVFQADSNPGIVVIV